MEKILPELIALLLQDLPESLVMLLLIFSLAKIKYEVRPIVSITGLMVLTNLAVRLLPIAFGAHTIILIFAFAIFTRLFTKAKLSKIFFSVLLTGVVLVIAEMITLMPLLKWTGVSLDECLANPYLKAAFALPEELLLLLLALGIRHYNLHKKGL